MEQIIRNGTDVIGIEVHNPKAVRLAYHGLLQGVYSHSVDIKCYNGLLVNLGNADIPRLELEGMPPEYRFDGFQTKNAFLEFNDGSGNTTISKAIAAGFILNGRPLTHSGISPYTNINDDQGQVYYISVIDINQGMTAIFPHKAGDIVINRSFILYENGEYNSTTFHPLIITPTNGRFPAMSNIFECIHQNNATRDDQNKFARTSLDGLDFSGNPEIIRYQTVMATWLETDNDNNITRIRTITVVINNDKTN